MDEAEKVSEVAEESVEGWPESGEVALKLGVSIWTVYRRCDEGVLRFRDVGAGRYRKRRIDPRSVKQFHGGRK